MRDVGDRFDMSISTFHSCMERVMNFLLSIAPSVIVWPENAVEQEEKAKDFEKVIDPGVINNHTTFINTKISTFS